MNIELSVLGEVIADDETDLLDIETTAPDIGGNQHTRLPGSELSHDGISLFLRHAPVHV
jgi:hypothetical protein